MMTLWRRLTALPLRYKLLAGLLIAALVTISVVVYTLIQYDRAIPTTASSLLHELVQDRGDAVNTVINDTSSTLIQVAQNSQNALNFALLNSSPNAVAPSQSIQGSFHTVLNTKPTLSQIRYVSLDGKVLQALPSSGSDDDTGQEYFQTLHSQMPERSANAVFVSRITGQPSPTVDLVTVVFQADQPIGFLVGTVDVAGSADPLALSFYTALKPLESTPYHIRFYLLGSDNRITVPGQQPVNATPLTEASVHQLAMAGGEGTLQFVSPLTGQPVLGTVIHLSGARQTLVAETPLPGGGLNSESGSFLLPLFGLLFVGLLLIGLVGLLFDVLIAQPVESLLVLANRVAQGRHGGPTRPVLQRDELGNLYTALNVVQSDMRYDVRSMEEVVAERTRDVEAAREIGLQLSDIDDQVSLMDATVALIRQFYSRLDSARIFLVDTRKEFFSLRASSDQADRARPSTGLMLPVSTQHVMGRAFLNGQAEVAIGGGNLLADMQSELALPLLVDGQPVGVLDLQSADSDTFSQADIRLFTTISAQFANSLRNTRLIDELRGRVREMDALNQQLVGEAWQRFINTRRTKATSAGEGVENWSELQFRAVETGDIVEEVTDDMVTFAAPVSLRGQVLGAVEWDVPRAAYNENARQLARELAARLAISADNARLFEQAQRVAQRERLVNEITSKLVQETDVSEILKVAVREVGQALHVSQTSIRLATSQDTDAGKLS